MNLVFLLTASLYLLSSAIFVAYLLGRSAGVLRLGRWSLTAALLAHLVLIGVLCSLQQNPLRDVRGALSLSGWLLGLGYLLVSFRSRLGLLGALVGPLALALLVVSRLLPAGSPPAALARSTTLLGKLHIALSAAGVAAFGLAAAVAILYLVQEAALKNKRLGPLSRLIPPLTSLDQAGRRLILLGFPLFTLAVITGLIWVTQLAVPEGVRLEHVISAVTWVIFAGLIVARVAVGLRGKRAAALTVLGFLALVIVLIIYLMRRQIGG